jgi:hypothetical protein
MQKRMDIKQVGTNIASKNYPIISRRAVDGVVSELKHSK